MMRTGQIPEHQAVDRTILAIAMTMTTARLGRTRSVVRKIPGKGRVQRMERGKGEGKATEQGKGKGNGNGKEKRIVKQTPGGDDISCAIALQLHMEMYEADSDTEG